MDAYVPDHNRHRSDRDRHGYRDRDRDRHRDRHRDRDHFCHEIEESWPYKFLRD